MNDESMFIADQCFDPMGFSDAFWLDLLDKDHNLWLCGLDSCDDLFALSGL